MRVLENCPNCGAEYDPTAEEDDVCFMCGHLLKEDDDLDDLDEDFRPDELFDDDEFPQGSLDY